MATQELASTSTASAIHERIAAFAGNHHDFLLWLIANPSRPQTEGMRKLGLAEETLYSWRRDIAGFKEVVDTIQDYRGDLRSEAARTLFNANILPLAQAMVARGLLGGRDAQRAGERILETVGVLPKGSAELPQAPVQVVTHTYVLVQREPGAQGVVVEGQARELPQAQEST